MKRVWCMILTIVMLLSLAACGGNNSGNGNQGNSGNNAGTSQSGGDTSTAAEYYNVYISADPTSMDISRVSDSYSSTIINNDGSFVCGIEKPPFTLREPLIRMDECTQGLS